MVAKVKFNKTWKCKIPFIKDFCCCLLSIFTPLPFPTPLIPPHHPGILHSKHRAGILVWGHSCIQSLAWRWALPLLVLAVTTMAVNQGSFWLDVKECQTAQEATACHLGTWYEALSSWSHIVEGSVEKWGLWHFQATGASLTWSLHPSGFFIWVSQSLSIVSTGLKLLFLLLVIKSTLTNILLHIFKHWQACVVQPHGYNSGWRMEDGG